VDQGANLAFHPKEPFHAEFAATALNEETFDTSFEVESRPLLDQYHACSTTLSEIFSAHTFALKTCAKGSILAPLCEDRDGSVPVPIKYVHPRMFRLLLRHIYGGIITAGEWKDDGRDLIEASDTYGLTSLKIEAESRYIKLITFSANDVSKHRHSLIG
jgi:hypothetical protein